MLSDKIGPALNRQCLLYLCLFLLTLAVKQYIFFFRFRAKLKDLCGGLFFRCISFLIFSLC